MQDSFSALDCTSQFKTLTNGLQGKIRLHFPLNLVKDRMKYC